MGYDAFIRRAAEEGEPIFPKKYTFSGQHTDGKKSLEQLRRELGAYEYSCQMQNDPIDESTVEFKRSWFRPLVIDDKMQAELSKARALMTVDPAFRLKETNDFSGLVVTKTVESNFVCVLEATKLKVNSKDLVDRIFTSYNTYKPSKVLIETVGAQLLLFDILKAEMRKRNVFFTIEELKTSTKETKAIRIRSLIPHYANGRILHAKGLNELEAELLEFPRGSHDDIIDALAYQVPFWNAIKGSAPAVVDPYMSLNWWKKQVPKSRFALGRTFDDFKFKKRF
jgi:phage terminase large subunit-like protein